ncbi:hypothetical protein CR513_25016, partial [Mucuna pruriens]
MKLKGLIRNENDRWDVKKFIHQAYRAKRKALDMIEGTGNNQYPCKATIITKCRLLISLDGYFLKGRYGGKLLSQSVTNELLLCMQGIIPTLQSFYDGNVEIDSTSSTCITNGERNTLL